MQSKLPIALGLDIGGTNIKSVAVSSHFEVLEEWLTPSRAALQGPDGVRSAIGEILSYYQTKEIKVTHIGIGCAGSIAHSDGVVINSPNFTSWNNIPLREWVTEDSGLPTVLENDANCAVIGEWQTGAAKGFKNVILITIGTGIGGGIILNGQLFRGSTGTAAELGHMSIYSNGIDCACGNRGCFERYCSASALKRIANVSDAKKVFEKRDEGPYQTIFNSFLEDLIVGLSSIANVFDPDCILLGGAVTKGLYPHLDEITSKVKSRIFPAISENIKILPTEHGNRSGALGAASLALLEALKE